MSQLHGVVVPAITPVDSEDRVDAKSFRRSLDRLVRAGVSAIFVGGSAGEGPLLAAREWTRMVEIAFETVDGRVPLFGGVMDTSSRRVLDKVKTLKGIGYRYFVLTPTFYIAVRAENEHLRLFGEAKAAAGKMEMIAYNIPSCTSSVLAVKTVCEMARRGWIRQCKESSGDLPYIKQLIRRGREFGLSVLAGDEPTSGWALLAGAAGIVPVCANYDPETFLSLYRAGAKGDRKEINRLMRRVDDLRQALLLSGPCWLTGIKYAISELGIGSGKPISPLEPADAKRKAVIRGLMRKDGTLR